MGGIELFRFTGHPAGAPTGRRVASTSDYVSQMMDMLSALKRVGVSPDWILSGSSSEKPEAGAANRLYVDKDTAELYLDTGSEWMLVGGSSASSQSILSGAPGGNAYEKICDIEITSNKTTIDVPTVYKYDTEYIIDVDLKAGATGTLCLSINGDTSSSRYISKVYNEGTISGSNAIVWSVLPQTNPGLPLCSCNAGEYTYVRGRLILTYGMPYVSLFHEFRYRQTSDCWYYTRVGSYTYTSTLDYLRFTSATSNVIGEGSRIRIYRPSLYRKVDDTGSQFYESAPHGSYRGLWRCACVIDASGNRTLSSYPALTRHANYWRVDIWRDRWIQIVKDDGLATASYNISSYVFRPDDKPVWNNVESSPIVPGVGRSTWQTLFVGRYWWPPGVQDSSYRYFDVVVCGQACLVLYAVYPPSSSGGIDFGIISSMFFKWQHKKPPNNINYNMAGRWDGQNRVLQSAPIPSSVYSDNDLNHWYYGMFGVFVYDNGTNIVVQGIPVNVEPL